jgi:para-nitrobenzyl esterase
MLRLSRELGLATVLLLVACASAPQGPPPLSGTSWQLVKFQGGDGKILTPDNQAHYTLSFGSNGALTARIDCNRGRGSWTSPAPGQVRLSLLALTRAMCPPGSLHDWMVKQLSYARSYVVKDGNLYLSLMADGGIYEFEPIPDAQR